MPSMFNARDAGNYEKLMGRWSRRLAPLFIEHAGIADGEEVLEIGCGTGSLTFTLPQKAALAGLTAVDQCSLMIRMDFADFADYWAPFASGEGALGAYVASLDDARRDHVERQLRSAYLTGRPDGERSFVAVALSCRGVVPQ